MNASTWVALRQLERQVEICESYDRSQFEYNDEVLLDKAIDELHERMAVLAREDVSTGN